MRIRRVLTGLAILVVGAVAAMFAIVRSIDFNSYKDLVVSEVRSATGRELVLTGDVHIGLSLTPQLEVEQVSFQNAAWGSDPQMLRFDRLEADVELLPLLSSQIRIKRIRLVGADILLETDSKGQGNWLMGSATGTGGSAPLPDVGEATIENAKIRLHNGITGNTRSFQVNRLTIAPSDTPGALAIAFDGKIDDVPVVIKGITGTFSDFVQGPLPINATGQIGDADVAVKGQIAQPGAMKGIALELSLSGKAASSLGPLIGIELPPLGPYQLQANLTGADGKYTFEGLSGRLGGSDFTGRVEVDQTTAPVTVNLTLASSHADLADFGVQASPQPAGAGDGRVFSAAHWDLTPLQALDGEFRVNVQQAVLGKTVLNNLAGEMALKSGLLKIVSLTAALGDGTVGVAANINAASKPPSVETRIRANNVDGAPLLAALGLSGAVTAGRINVEAALQGPGTSLRDLMAGLNGGIYLEMGQGAIRNDFARLMFADVFQLITLGGTGDAARVNCAVTRLASVDGIAAAKSMVVDTPGVTVLGSGEINLRDETLHLRFDSSSKQVNLANLAVPINVGGTLSHPSVAPDPLGAVGNTADFAARAANTATFGVLSSLTGLGESKSLGPNPCVDAVAAGVKAKSSAADQIINDVGKATEGVGEGAKDLGEGAIDATKKAGEGAGEVLQNLGKDLGGALGN
jgi:hypothetical protein